ncbi:hypothetical protein GGTG_09653 [Gaeumannomyces tritici R3-111a-1]|uniref:Ribosomal protein L9 domain-containing protein n=1 Tax=Gaeumannomyces tritici (strain R3-111a-1) TaxID=644352 RepID=J3P815_GAET3|nr:hypothetical protein GGTG_09653 [Gaeumannomyces tritici R3-111a-1]EJT72798.1 hypothetical protein GGTG_09653 [Gaeumannomyces tritici R3-111a-1]
MPAPLLARAPPTCLSCLRRTLIGAGAAAVAADPASSVSSLPSSSAAAGLTQVRGKKTKGRQYDQGVLVRLLKDIRQFGPKNSIFLAPRGRMRNMWYPSRKAEYMTTARFAELGLTRDAIGERDPLFAIAKKPAAPEAEQQAAQNAAAADGLNEKKKKASVSPLMSPEPEQAAVLLQSIIPEVMIFRRRVMAPKKEEPPKPYRSPLLADDASISTDSAAAAAAAEAEPVTTHAAGTPIFGSVSTADLAQVVREMLLGHGEAARIPVKEEHFHIQGVVDEGGNAVPDATKVRALGRWTVSISIPHEGVAPAVKPVVKHFEVVEEESS